MSPIMAVDNLRVQITFRLVPVSDKAIFAARCPVVGWRLRLFRPSSRLARAGQAGIPL